MFSFVGKWEKPFSIVVIDKFGKRRKVDYEHEPGDIFSAVCSSKETKTAYMFYKGTLQKMKGR